MKTHLLDTTVLAALLNGRPAAVTLLAPLLAPRRHAQMYIFSGRVALWCGILGRAGWGV